MFSARSCSKVSATPLTLTKNGASVPQKITADGSLTPLAKSAAVVRTTFVHQNTPALIKSATEHLRRSNSTLVFKEDPVTSSVRACTTPMPKRAVFRRGRAGVAIQGG